jgi:sulfur carrier protein
MEITLNGEAHSLANKMSLTQLVSELGLTNRRLAIELNQDIVPRGEYSSTQLQEADQVEIINAIGGG